MRVQLPDLAMDYEIRGEGGPALLLLHGFPLHRGIWNTQLAVLGENMRVIAPDLRGHGQTDAPPGPYSMEGMARDCAGLLDELNVTEPVVVAGLSMGGYVALAFARQFADRLAGLVLAATRAGADSVEGKAGRDRNAALARDKGPEAIVEAMLPKMLAPDTYAVRPNLVEEVRRIMRANSAEGMAGALIGMRDRPDSTPLLEQISVPVLVIHGLEDQLLPYADAEAMHQRLKDSRLKLVPGAGHLLNMEQPEVFNAEVRTFVSGL
jgi:3-oxoadipate enol-lactonase